MLPSAPSRELRQEACASRTGHRERVFRQDHGHVPAPVSPRTGHRRRAPGIHIQRHTRLDSSSGGLLRGPGNSLRHPGLLPRIQPVRPLVHGRPQPGLQLPRQEIPVPGDLSRPDQGRGRRPGRSPDHSQDPSRVRVQPHLPGEQAFESAGMEYRASQDEDLPAVAPGGGGSHRLRQAHDEGSRVPPQKRL